MARFIIAGRLRPTTDGVDLKSKPTTKTKAASETDPEIGRLQTTILSAVLSGKPLPGSAQPMSFPDLSFVLREPTVLIKNINIAAGFSVPSGSKPARVISQNELEAEAKARGEVAFLEFAPPRVSADEAEFVVEARLFSPGAGKQILGLSSCHARFRKMDGQWRAVGEPIYSAA